MNRIKSERVGAGLTQSELAKEIGVHENTIRNWEKTDADIPASELIAMHRIFGCSIEFLLGVSENRAVN